MRNSIKFFFLVIVPIAGILAYLIMTDKMIIRLPVIVHENPKVTFVTGDVHYREDGDDKWKIAIVGETLSMGDELKTGKNSLLDLRFTESMAIRLTAESSITLDKLTIKKMQLKVNRGSMYGKFERIFKEHSIKVITPTAVASVRGTELGFRIMERKSELESSEKEEKGNDVKKTGGNTTADKKEPEGSPDEVKKELSTTVFSLSGITEIKNPNFNDKTVLLSYQNKLIINENTPPGDIEKLTEDDHSRLRSILNSIHTEEVLLISDKINFKVGSARILKSSYPELDKIYKVLLERDVTIRIEGHTDNIGSDSSNQALSVKRAEAIKDYFYNKGIQLEQIQTVGYGESRPIAGNKTRKGRSRNRRVEFIIVDE